MRTEINIVEKIEKQISVEDIYQTFINKPYCMILDSSLNKNKLGKYSVVVFDPFLVFKSKGMCMEIIRGTDMHRLWGNPFEELRKLLNKYKTDVISREVPFTSGCVGYLSYELCRLIEELPVVDKENAGISDMVMGFYNNALIIDHTTEDIYVSASSVGLPECTDMEDRLKQRIESIKQCLEAYQNDPDELSISSERNGEKLESYFTRKSYCEMVQKAREYIRNGDIFQVNLSQKFKTRIRRRPDEVYTKLRKISPAPFSAYLSIDDIKVISSSPERFIKIEGRTIETRPIKGTRPRGKTPEEDNALREELLSSKKDRAELTMIIDLERNDIGKVCKIGSVKVDKFIEIEEYATVFHLVSTITGDLEDGKDVVDCLMATFPGGSITGAPKVRAMEIIDELEPTRRDIYTGAIGYIDFSGNADFNIAIRTIIVKGNEAFYNVGGGIVWDSVPEKEYQETLDKGKALMRVLTE
ncbi:MAG: aminodeoxychorismate synthase component I [Clostridia bacterium]|nr:aminodeoxychorismate synthase component I [Clostridia bacterium]